MIENIIETINQIHGANCSITKNLWARKKNVPQAC